MQEKASSNPADLSPILLISMIFSVMSILASTVTQVSRLCQKHMFDKRVNFSYDIEIKSNFILKSKALRSYHAFAHSRIKSAIMDILSDIPKVKKLLQRSDIVMTSDVYYIESRVYTVNEIEAHFQLNILTNNLKAQKIFFENIKQMSLPGDDNHGKLIKVLTNCLELSSKSVNTPHDLTITMTDANMKAEHINNGKLLSFAKDKVSIFQV